MTKSARFENRIYASIFSACSITTVWFCDHQETYMHGVIDQQAYMKKRGDDFLTQYTLDVTAARMDEARGVLANEGFR